MTRNFHSFHLQWFIFHFRTITFLSHSFTRRWCQALIEKHPCRSPARNKRINTQKCTSCSMCEWEPRGEHKILIGYFYILDIIHRQLRQWCFFKSRTAVCDALHMMNLYNVHNPNYSSVFSSLYYFNIVVMQCNKNKTKSEFHRFAEHFHTHLLWQIHSFRVFFSRDNSSHPSSSSSSQHKCLSQLHHNWKFLLSAMLSLPPRFFFCHRSHHFHQGSLRECGFKHFKQMADKIMIGLSSYSSIQTKN